MDDFVNISDLKERAKELNCLYFVYCILKIPTIAEGNPEMHIPQKQSTRSA